MRKVIAAINMTLDGFCDHTAILPDAEIHQHYTELLSHAGAILYGRKTFELMKFWQPLAANPSGEKAMDDFAAAIDKIPKIVFSNTLKDTDPEALGWKSAKLAKRTIEEEVSELRKQPGKDIFAGSRSLILHLMKRNLMDEFQLCVHPVIAGNGMPLFENLTYRNDLKLIRTKIFRSGAITLYYEPAKMENA